MSAPRYPALFQVNTRVRLAELSTALGRPATLDDIPEAELDQLARDGFDLVWFLGVWQTGEAARGVSAIEPRMAGGISPGPARFPRRLTSLGPALRSAIITSIPTLAGMRPSPDCVNACASTGCASSWISSQTMSRRTTAGWMSTRTSLSRERKQQLAAQPQNYRRLDTASGSRILAYGRDPYFAGWPDTLQLNYGNPALQEALLGELQRIAGQCDGVRCDMAMLVLPEIFERTWGIAASPFWPGATAAVRAKVPGFLFLAEVYWDLEWTLQQQGFDYTYDKRLYDRLVQGHARPVREHLLAGTRLPGSPGPLPREPR